MEPYMSCRWPVTIWSLKWLLAHSKNELMQWRGVRRLSVCKLFRKSLLLADNWPDRHQTCTRWSTRIRVSLHPGCSHGQGQGQRSRDMHTFLDSWNELLRHWRSGLFLLCHISSRRFTIGYWPNLDWRWKNGRIIRNRTVFCESNNN